MVHCNCTPFFGLPGFWRIASEFQVGGEHKVLQQKHWHDTSNREKWPLDTVAQKELNKGKWQKISSCNWNLVLPTPLRCLSTTFSLYYDQWRLCSLNQRNILFQRAGKYSNQHNRIFSGGITRPRMGKLFLWRTCKILFISAALGCYDKYKLLLKENE